MEEKYREYYKQLFRVHSGGLFYYGIGESFDDWGDEYDTTYETELDEYAEQFADYCIKLYKMGIELDKNLILIKLYEYLYTLLKKEEKKTKELKEINVDRLTALAYLMLHGAEQRVSMNNERHPLNY